MGGKVWGGEVSCQRECNVMGLFGGVNNGADPWISYPGKAPSGSQLEPVALNLTLSWFVEYQIGSVCYGGQMRCRRSAIKKNATVKNVIHSADELCNEWSESNSR
jgi:hypothetical protein